jgi:hypothetical protein
MSFFDIFKRKPTPEKFARELIRRAERNGFAEPMRFEPEQFRIVYGSKDQGFINLDNIYRDYCAASGRNRQLVLSKCLELLGKPEVPESFLEAKGMLMPVIRSRGYDEYLRLSGALSGEALPFSFLSAPFSPDSFLGIACDLENSMQVLTARQLSDWNVSFEEAWAASMDNLRDRTVDRFERIGPGLFSGAWGDAYDSSRILLSDLVYRLGVPNPVAMIPTRDRLLVTSGNDKQGMLEMVDFAAQCKEQEGRSVSALLYKFENGRAEPCIPDDPEVRRRLENLRRRFLAEDYSSQTEMMRQLNERQGVDIFVASYLLVEEAEAGEMCSVGTWSRDVDTLLPKTDKVALGIHDDDDNPTFLQYAPWDDVVRVCGYLMEEQGGVYPVRFRVKQFPSDEQLEQLRDVLSGDLFATSEQANDRRENLPAIQKS